MPSNPPNQQMYPLEKMANNPPSHKINQPNQGFGTVREPFNGKSPSHPQGNIQQQPYHQQFYPHSKYSNKAHQTTSPHQQIPNNSMPPGHLSNNYGQTANPSNFNNYPHSVVTSYQSQQSYDYNSPSSSSMSTMNYATPSPSQYSFASSSPSASTIQETSSDIRQQNVQQPPTLVPMDDETNSNRDYAMTNQFKIAADNNNKSFNHSTQQLSYSIDSMSGHYNTGGDNGSYPTEIKNSLKKYRHKQQTNSKTPSIYGSGPNDFKMDDQYSNYSMEGESTLSFLEKTASSIDESKSAFKASLSNITKPTPDMLGYGTQSLYASSSGTHTPIKAKAKSRSRGRKTTNKTDNLLTSEPTSSPIQPLPMKQTDKIQQSSNAKDDIIDSRLKSSSSSSSLSGAWRIDEKITSNKQLSTEHFSGPVGGMNSHSIALGEKNLTIPHTDVNTTYNHSDKTYQYSGQSSTHVLPSPFLLSHSQSKPESSLYSSHGTVHHPFSRPETSISNSTSVTINSIIPSQTNTVSISSHPYSVHTPINSLQHTAQQPTISMSSSSQHSSTLSTTSPFNNTTFDPIKPAQPSHLLSQQEQSPPVSLSHTPQLDTLGLYSHSQHYSPYGKFIDAYNFVKMSISALFILFSRLFIYLSSWFIHTIQWNTSNISKPTIFSVW